jgi:two-component system, OmpR family, response regulator
MPDEPRLSILVVEDEDDSAQSLAELLTLGGHAVRVASSGPEALREALGTFPDIVLLDIGLPGMDGWEVARRLRGQCRDKQPFVVAVTGYETTSDQWRSADAGIDLHLVKPVDPANLTGLLSWVRELLCQKHS